MATKLVKIAPDERYPDFDVWLIEEWWSCSYAMEVTITEEEYKEFKEIQEKYNLMQEYLLTLYNKARKYAKAEKFNG
jgi:pantothenate kinase